MRRERGRARLHAGCGLWIPALTPIRVPGTSGPSLPSSAPGSPAPRCPALPLDPRPLAALSGTLPRVPAGTPWAGGRRRLLVLPSGGQDAWRGPTSRRCPSPRCAGRGALLAPRGWWQESESILGTHHSLRLAGAHKGRWVKTRGWWLGERGGSCGAESTVPVLKISSIAYIIRNNSRHFGPQVPCRTCC